MSFHRRKKIVFLTGVLPLALNPRTFKEAAALASAGHEVLVLGMDYSLKQFGIDKDIASRCGFALSSIASVGNDTWERRAKWLYYRARRECRIKLNKLFRQESKYQLGFFVPELLAKAKASRADFFVAHTEPALYVAAELLKTGCRVGVDLEDWHSEDLPAEVRRNRPIKLLKKLEKELLCGAVHTTCTSQAMSEALVTAYGCRPPTVIYNAFPWKDRQSIDGLFKDRQDLTIPSVHWFSQTIGTDRGLDDLFSALPFVKPGFEIHLRGNPSAGFEKELMAKIPEVWRKRVFIHPLVSNDELLSRIAEHDIGFASEQSKTSRNRDLTVTNKILYYLLGGLAVVASDTEGQNEIAKMAEGAVRTYRSGDALSLAAELNSLFSSPKLLDDAKHKAIAVAEREFCWEQQAPVFVKNIETALAAG